MEMVGVEGGELFIAGKYIYKEFKGSKVTCSRFQAQFTIFIFFSPFYAAAGQASSFLLALFMNEIMKPYVIFTIVKYMWEI